MDIHSGGSVSNNDGFISYAAGSSGSVTVDGPGSTWTNSARLLVGFDGFGSLAVSNGGTVSSAEGYVAWGTGSSGTVTVDGPGSTLANSGVLYVGRFGIGSLAVSNGATVGNSSGYIGYFAGGSGTVKVDGAGSAWTNTGHLYTGVYGTGSLAVTGGARVSNFVGLIGYFAGGSGTVTVDGAGSTWANSSDLYIGSYGTGLLAVSNGATVGNVDGVIGAYANSWGKVEVDGAASTWINNGELYIGYSGTALLDVSNGATVSNSLGWIGADSGSSGAVTVDGAGSTWANSEDLYVGYFGTGSLAINNGAKVDDWYGVIGVDSTGSGAVTVDGAGSTWANSGGIYIGYSGIGSLAVSDYGLVSARDEVLVAGNFGSTGSLGVASGGILQALALTAGSGDAEVTFDGGTLRAIADNQDFITGFGATGLATGLAIDAGGLIIDDNGYAIATDASAFTGVGGLTKTGAGTLTLGGINTYLGATTVALGTLKAGAADVFSPASAFTVSMGATLDLDGYNQTTASLSNSGAVRIGSATSANPVGATLTVNGNYESNGGSLYLRTALYDDSSLTDKLIADSVTTGAGGATRLYVANIGGAGAYTTSSGIQVVRVTTASDSGAFALGAPVTAGIYEYVLTQGADQSWYLTGIMSSGGGATQQTALYNPNIGSYLGNQYAAAAMFNQNLPDRRNSVRSPDQALWIRTNYNSIRSNILGNKQKVTIKTVLVQAGADLVKEDDFLAGVYVGYGHSDIDNRSRQTGTGADGKVDGYHIGAYASWLPEKNKGPYVDMWTYYALYANELSGSAQPFGKTEYDSSGYALSGEVGYGHELRKNADGDAWILEPHLQLTYVNIDADSFTDSNGTRYTDNRSRGWRTRAGARFYGQQGSGKTGLNPFVEINWLHNRVDNGIRLDGKYISSHIARNAGEAKIGVQGQAADNLNLWGHIGTQQGGNSFEQYEVQLGLAWRW